MKERLNETYLKYKGYPVINSKFEEKISRLLVKNASKFENVDTYFYDEKRNILILNEDYFKDSNVNMDNYYVQMVLDISNSNGLSKNISDRYYALNKGIRESLALNLTGEQHLENINSDEYIYFNLLSRIIDVSSILKAYSTSNPSLIDEDIKKLGGADIIQKTFDVNSKANYNLMSKNNLRHESLIGEIEYELLDIYSYTNPTKEQLKTFESNMVYSSEVFGNRNEYKNVSKNKAKIQDLIKSYVESIEMGKKKIV